MTNRAQSQGLRGFLADYEARHPGGVLRVSDRVALDYDVTAIAMEQERRGETPVLWFDNVEGSAFPVVANLFGERARLAMALGVGLDGLTAAWANAGKQTIAPKLVNGGPVREVVLSGADVDLARLPIMKHFAEDGGRYITNSIVVARHPETGVRNASYHRLQVRGRNRLSTSLHSRRHLWTYANLAEERGEPIPVSIVIGAHPLFAIGGGLWKGPIDVDEYDIIGGLLGEPLEILAGESVAIESPAHAEIVLEGNILPGAREDEGPFAEFTGYASARSTRHVIEVTTIMHRRDALYQDIIPGISDEHTLLLAVPMEARILGVLRQNHPNVAAVAMPKSGTCRMHVYIALRDPAAGQAKNAAMTALAEDLSLKLAVVVDADVDVTRDQDVMWAVCTRMQADQDVEVLRACMGAILDPSNDDGLTSKMIIDATRPRLADFPPRHTIPGEAEARARRLLDGIAKP